MRVAVAEVFGAHQEVAGTDLAAEVGIVFLHRRIAEQVDILDLDVLDADDLVDIEIRLFEDPGGPAFQVRESHVSGLRSVDSPEGRRYAPSIAEAATLAALPI